MYDRTYTPLSSAIRDQVYKIDYSSLGAGDEARLVDIYTVFDVERDCL